MAAIMRISELIAGISDGDFDDEATKEFHKLVEAVEAGNGNGKLTITVALKKEDRKMVAKPTVKATIPIKPVTTSTFFVDAKGRLTDEDPRQARLPFKDVSAPTKNVRDLEAERRKRDAAAAGDAEPNDTDTKKGN